MAVEKYDAIGSSYATHRTADPAIEAAITEALGNSKTVLNVGAGTGSYEPASLNVVAIEPSKTMIAQRPRHAAPAIVGRAENLPFADKQFDASMAIMTIHHWDSLLDGIAEMQRVTKNRIVIMTFDPEFGGFWLEKYLPELKTIGREGFPRMASLANVLGHAEIRRLAIPAQCSDGFMCAYWRRPDAYLNGNVRSSISVFSILSDIDEGLERLASDLADGTWERENEDILSRTELDLGYRLVVSDLSGSS